MKIKPVEPIYKSTLNSKPNPNKNHQNQQDNKKKKNKSNQDFAAILKISSEGRKKYEDDYER